MKQQTISIINGVEISAVTDENHNVFVPVKPICQAIGIDHDAQRQRIKRHRKLSSVAVTVTATGTDGKSYDMLALPLQYVYGWLFSIDLSMVAESALPTVEKYQDECYEVLYRHFAGSLRRRVEENEAEIAALKAVNDAILQVKEAKTAQRKAEEHLEAIRKNRLAPQPSLF